MLFVLNRFEGTEGLGALFEYRIGALSLKDNFNLDQLIGRNCNVRIKGVDGLDRHFNGVMTEGNYTGSQYGLYGYQFVLRPWLHLLSRTSDCRIFSNMKPNKIIAQVFSDRGFTDFRDNLKEDYPTLEYTVQYRETDLNFVCRLMEKYGMYYYFEHTQSKHTMVLCDAPSCHDKIPGLASIPLLPVTQESRRDRQQFDSWSTARALQTGKDALNDYFYEKPSQDLLAKADKHGGYEHASLETYDYPGGYDNKSDGEKWAKVRVQAVQAQDDHRIAIGAAPSVFPGGKITLEDAPDASENKEYVVLRCTHSYVDQTYISGGGAPVAYAGTYELMDSSRQFRSLLTTRRSVVVGWQSALVVGKQGEEIDVDKAGPHPRAVLLGSQEGQISSHPGRAILGRQDARRLVLPAHRRRGVGAVRGRRSRPADGVSARSTTAKTPCRRRCPTRRPNRASSPNRARTATAITC